MEQVFNVVQVLDLIGVLQCVIILALVFLKATDIRKAIPTAAFFAALGLGFGLPAAADPQLAHWDAASVWIAQGWIPTLSYFIILQIAHGELPERRHLWVLVLPLFGPVAVFAFVAGVDSCGGSLLCPESVTLLRVFGVVPGAVVLLLLWSNRGLFTRVGGQRENRDRYWVVLTFIVFNILNLGIDIPRAAEVFEPTQAAFARTIFGLTFVYLVTTLVFRIDPKPVVLLPGMLIRRSIELTPEELALADKIRNLMRLDKLYQEPSFSRGDLARELNVSENVLSRVINSAFTKSFRKLLNDHRVEEAKLLLRDSDMQVTQIAFDAGFNSLASFNRVFKEMTGQTPTAFRVAAAAAPDRQAASGEPDRQTASGESDGSEPSAAERS
ncbi:MAG: helix-turn-helix transcriptional regulator [Proteobacteria bacterium]|nr:helix-turn-helix transcriptional regulator [Pseudomonadota bacterium]